MKKFLALFLSAAISTACLAAVGCGEKQPDDENSLIIDIWEAGYGTSFLERAAAAYEEKNPGKQVFVNVSSDSEKLRVELPSGPRNIPTDIYFGAGVYFDLISIGETTIAGEHYDHMLADLSAVYEATPEGEDRTIAEKLTPSYVDYYEVDGKYYMLPWAGGMGGLVYNKDMFEENGWEIPRTTDELFELCDTILTEGDGVYPFFYSGIEPYWDFVYDVWFAQYEGLEAFNKSWEGEYYDEARGSYVFGPEIMAMNGKYETLLVMEKILNQIPADGSVYTHPNSSVATYTEAQLYFLMGQSAMMPNGDWLENEMRENNTGVNMSFMPIPVISALGTKLGISEEQLRAAVDYVDGNTSQKPDLSDETLGRVREARSIVKTIGVNHTIAVPVYSNAIPLAIDFLTFLFSDEGMGIYFEETGGSQLPGTFDVTSMPGYAELSVFQLSRCDILNEEANVIYTNVKNPLYFKGGLSVFTNIASWGRLESMLSSSEPEYKKDAYDIYTGNLDYVRRNWSSICTKAGILA